MSSSNERLNCLIILSGAKQGNSLYSFYDSYKILSTELNVHVATPNGCQPDFVSSDYRSRSMFNDFKTKTCSNPLSFANIDPELYSALVIPHSPGAVIDLANDLDLAEILKHFAKHQKVLCAIGMGVAGLFPAFEDGNVWSFRRFTLTTISVFELASNPDFANLPIIPEDVIKDRGALYSCTNHIHEVHVVVDRHLITGQNEKSTITAVQNLLIHCSQKKS